MKKVLVCLAILILGIVVNSASLSMWVTGYSNEEKRILQEVITDGFTKETGIEVKLETISWNDYEKKYILAAVTGDGPDVAHMGAIVAPQLGVRGSLVRLTTFPNYQ